MYLRYQLLFLFLSVYFASANLFAKGAYVAKNQTTIIAQQCGIEKNNCKRSTPEPLKSALLSCELSMSANKCQELQNEPEFLGDLKNCDVESFCEDALTPIVESIKSCGDGFVLGFGESADSFVKWVESVSIRIEEKNKYLSKIDQCLECKKELVRETPFYSEMTDEELTQAVSKMTSAQLLVDKQNKENMFRRLKRNGPNQSLYDRSVQAEKMEQERLQLKTESNFNSKAFFMSIKDGLEKKNARLNCLKPKRKAEMICWGASYFVDPLLVYGAAKKGAQGAKYFLKLFEEAEGVKAAQSSIPVQQVGMLSDEAGKSSAAVTKNIDASKPSLVGKVGDRMRSVINKTHTIGADTKNILQELISLKNSNLESGKSLSESYLGELKLNGPNGQRGNPVEELQMFRKETKTSIFSQNEQPDKILNEFNAEMKRGNAEGRLAQIEGHSNTESHQFVFKFNENQYKIFICKLSQGCSSHGGIVPYGEITTMYPLCGKDIVHTITLGAARKLIESTQTVQYDDFFKKVPCK